MFLGKNARLGSELTKRLSSGLLAGGKVQVTTEKVSKQFWP